MKLFGRSFFRCHLAVTGNGHTGGLASAKMIFLPDCGSSIYVLSRNIGEL